MSREGKRGRPPHDDVLTPAEWRVVEFVRHGLTNRKIAERLGVSADAVKFHVANALSKLGFTNRQALRHWNGVTRASILYGRKDEMTEPASLGPIGQIARSVKDIKAAEEWYKTVLRLPHLFTFGNLAFFDCDGVRLFLSEGDGPEESQSIIYFRVGDIHAAHSELSSRGAEFLQAPHMIHRHEDGREEWMAFFNDNEGRPLGLMSLASG